MWVPTAQRLSQHHRVFLWDMPGYGDSITEVDPPLDLESQSQRLAALVEYWRLEEPHVIAHDIGGAIALGAHLFEGVEYSSLYLLDIVTLSPWGSPFFRLVADNEGVFAQLPPPLHRALVEEYIAGAGSDRLENRWIDELRDPWITSWGQRAFYRQIAELTPDFTERISPQLGDVRCPVRIGWGDSDPWIDIEQSTRLSDELPGPPKIAVFPSAGHLVPLESPDSLHADLSTWLKHLTDN